MAHRKRPHLTGTVAAETLVLANKAMDEMDLPLGHALDVIIREWSSSKEIEPVNSTPKSPDLRVLQNTLDNIDARLSWIEGAITDATFYNEKKE